MGGKSKPRVAGNVKPSSSGRIRELLMNTTGSPGNIITFSALSNNPQPVSQTIKKKPPKAEKQIDTAQKVIEREDKPATTSPTKQALVVKRVGDRDYFVRVKVPEHTESVKVLEDGSNSDTLQIFTGKTGILKPTESTIDQETEQNSVSEQENITTNEDSIQDGSEDEEEDDDFDGSDIDDDANAQDFDAIVDRLAQFVISGNEEKEAPKSLDEVTDAELEREREKMKLFRMLVRNHSQDLSIEEWDMLVRSINQWISWISKVSIPIKDQDRLKFCTHVFKCLNQFLVLARAASYSDNDSSCSRFILESWNDFHSSSVYKELVRIYLNLISSGSELSHDDQQSSIIEAVAEIIVEVNPGKVMLEDRLMAECLGCNKPEFDPDFRKPDNGLFLDIDESKLSSFSTFCGLLMSYHRAILVPAHIMLTQIMPRIHESIQQSINVDQDDLDQLLILPPTPLMAVLTSRDLMVSALLSDYKAGDISVTIDPNTDSYGCTLAYLFAWDLVIQFIVGLDKELGHRVIHALKQLKLIQRLLDNVFMLLPPLGERDSLNLRLPRSKRVSQVHQWTLNEFLRAPLKSFIRRQENEIELVALHVYFSMASHMPVTVRKWFYNNHNQRLCLLVDQYTVKHISQVICSQEMDNILRKCQERVSESDNLSIKARPSAKEVYATYTRDEFKLELTIRLPNNYPLGAVQIDAGKRVGVSDTEWRSWLLQLTTFLSLQNGPILDGIDLWRCNIAKKFEGTEKCTICFSILSTQYQLPRKKCQNCAKMFHNICLYKWFESSGNSTCPLCREPW